ncbi:hypothetical protein HY837_00340 [archaeon]|nr:hypothetical protein [archaeon]
MKTQKVDQVTGNPVVDLVLNTVEKKKQAFIFVNTKASAEKCAEDISEELDKTPACELIAEKILNVLGSPTKQCKRLANCVRKGSAFHHSGLHSKQREIIEDEFRLGNIRFISATPTLAAGLSMPAFRVIIRDVQRYGRRGMEFIPVLEFLQMAGRAGRPEFDDFGEAIVIAKSEGEKENLSEKYLLGEPEDIYSKLAVEPVLRTYVLSLISAAEVNNFEKLMNFFKETFWAFQFKDMNQLSVTIKKMVKLLVDWGFIQELDNKFRATYSGKRIAELYIDPYTANEFVKGLKRSSETVTLLGLLHLICNTLEMRPLLNVTTKDFEKLQEKSLLHEKEFLSPEPSEFESEYEDWLKSLKTALMMHEWCEEADEDFLMKEYNVRPGETRAKINLADWLLYALSELARIEQKQNLLAQINKARTRLKYGVKEELLPLLKFKGIGRARARKLFNNKIRDVKDVKSIDFSTLKKILGEKSAEGVKMQVGEKIVGNQRQLSDTF